MRFSLLPRFGMSWSITRLPRAVSTGLSSVNVATYSTMPRALRGASATSWISTFAGRADSTSPYSRPTIRSYAPTSPNGARRTPARATRSPAARSSPRRARHTPPASDRGPEASHRQTKLAASSACAAGVRRAPGVRQSGRARVTVPLVTRDATMRSGAAPRSTQRSSAESRSWSASIAGGAAPALPKLVAPVPPAQWPIPGTMNRAEEAVGLLLEPARARTRS